MEPIVLWQSQWSHNAYVPLYLFFGGLTAGVFIVAVLADLVGIKWKRFETFSKVAGYSAIVTLGLAGFFITVHLGKPERGMAFPIFFTNYGSWMTRGGWIVGTSGALLALYDALWYFGARPLVRRVVGIIGIPFLAMLAVYTGLLLSGGGLVLVPLWSQKFLPLLFLNSGITTGLAGAGFIFLLAWPFLGARDEDPQRIVRWVSLAVVVFILLELYELYNFMAFLEASGRRTPTGQFVAPKGGALAYEYVTKGKLAPWFWGGVIGVGLTIPLVLTLVEFFVRPWARVVATTKFALILIGGAILRFVIVWGGDLKAPLDFPPSKWPVPPLAGG
ncbi:MAG: NrfD/PsrC family molybdoenzyme membrane anchor subunit [Dehalococcoidia bacterium]